jgi:hypothetical protein
MQAWVRVNDSELLRFDTDVTNLNAQTLLHALQADVTIGRLLSSVATGSCSIELLPVFHRRGRFCVGCETVCLR